MKATLCVLMLACGCSEPDALQLIFKVEDAEVSDVSRLLVQIRSAFGANERYEDELPVDGQLDDGVAYYAYRPAGTSHDLFVFVTGLNATGTVLLRGETMITVGAQTTAEIILRSVQQQLKSPVKADMAISQTDLSPTANDMAPTNGDLAPSVNDMAPPASNDGANDMATNFCATSKGGCSDNATCQNGPTSAICTCKDGFVGNGVVCTAAQPSCLGIKTANPGAADGVYTIDPTGGSTTDAVDVYCDMTRDGGGWTKLLHYHTTAYRPTRAAVGDIARADSPNFAKLADAVVNAVAPQIFRFQGPTSPTGKKAYVWRGASVQFNDTARAWGLFATSPTQACERATLATCGVPVNVGNPYFDSLDFGGGNADDRYFADYNGTPSCFGRSMQDRCVTAGYDAPPVGTHPIIPDLSIWMR